MNLHLMIDAPFYTDLFVKKCEELSTVKNDYIFISEKKKPERITSNKIQVLKPKEAWEFYYKRPFTKIFVHFLNNAAVKFILKIDKIIPVYWVFWGADGYRHPKLQGDIFLPATLQVLKRNKNYYWLRVLKKRLFDIKKEHKFNKALMRINFCCTQVKGDYTLISSVSTSFKMEHRYFAYQSVSSDQSSENGQMEDDIKKKKYTILLGNSANASNNHIDVLNLLENFSGIIDKIICPLSYGGSKQYINSVIDHGRNLFGEKFRPLNDFLPKEDYDEELSSVDIGVFYHSRQQAYGNTISLLRQNKKILMNPSSTLYQMYVDFKIDNVFSDFDELTTTELIHYNKNLFKKLGEDVVDGWYKDLLN